MAPGMCCHTVDNTKLLKREKEKKTRLDRSRQSTIHTTNIHTWKEDLSRCLSWSDSESGMLVMREWLARQKGPFRLQLSVMSAYIQNRVEIGV